MKPDFKVNCAQCNQIVLVKRKKFLDKSRGGKSPNFFCNDNCYLAFRKTGNNVICLTCNKIIYKTKSEIDSGLNLFCSSSCATTFNNLSRTETTKGKIKTLNCAKCRLEFQGAINSPISTSLCNDCRIHEVERTCQICNTKIYGSYGIKYCDICRDSVIQNSIQTRINNGTLFSKSIKCEFKFHYQIIKCDSKLEYVCLVYFSSNFDVYSMARSSLKLNYYLDGENKKYFPDFEIILRDGTKYLIECKGVVGKNLSNKWGNYNKKSFEKRKVLEEYANNNGYIPYWFDQQEHNSLYQKIRKIIPT